MRTARFFVPEDWIARSAEAFCIPAGSVHRQITAVLRMKVGDRVSLLTGDGSEIEGRITEMTRSAVMGVIAGSKVPDPLLPEITICAAMTKRDTFEWMLQKCTEIGVHAFVPLVTDRVIKRPKETPQRWRDIIKEAAEQSGRVTLPHLSEPMTIGQAIGHTEGSVRIFMHETGGNQLPKLHKTSHVALFVGPEGGFSDQELAAARDAQAHVVTLGNLVFRAETAAIVGTTLLRFN